MDVAEKRLRHALWLSVRFYQHPVSQAHLQTYGVDHEIWHILAQHGFLEQTPDHLVTMSDKGLKQAQKLFISRRDELAKLKRLPKPEVESHRPDYSDLLGQL